MNITHDGRPRCEGKNARGKPCRNPATLSGPWCHAHDPRSRDRHVTASLAGGRVACTGHTKAGRPCRAFAMPETDPPMCLHHSSRPDHVEVRARRQELSRKGAAKRTRLGKAVVQASRTDLGQNVYGKLLQALDDVYEGRLPPARASAMAAIANVMVKVTQTAQLALAVEELKRQAARNGDTGAVRVTDAPVRDVLWLDSSGDVLDGEYTEAED